MPRKMVPRLVEFWRFLREAGISYEQLARGTKALQQVRDVAGHRLGVALRNRLERWGQARYGSLPAFYALEVLDEPRPVPVPEAVVVVEDFEP
jgi:hypothetical protein